MHITPCASMPSFRIVYYMTMTVLAQLQQLMPSLPKAELKVARVLREDYPSAGLGTVAAVAAGAEVSGPTVLRLVERLGFEGFPEFQQALREELSMRTKSPLELYTEATDSVDPLERARQRLMGSLQRTFQLLDPAEVSQAVELISNLAKNVHCTGGRFTGVVAQSLALHLEVLRPNTSFLSTENRIAKVLDFSAKDVVVAFDLRRYQDSTAQFAREAKRRGASIVLVTDEWMSPITSIADVVLKVGLEAPSPFDSLIGAEALVETLVAGIVDLLGDQPHDRIAAYDALWGTDEIGDAGPSN